MNALQIILVSICILSMLGIVFGWFYYYKQFLIRQSNKIDIEEPNDNLLKFNLFGSSARNDYSLV